MNSDDPAYFGGYLNKNCVAIYDALNLTEKDIKKMVNNSFQASFLQSAQKEKLYNK